MSYIVQFKSIDGEIIGDEIDCPVSTTPDQLTTLINHLLENEDPLPYSFFIDDVEIVNQLKDTAEEKKLTTEDNITIRFQAQAIFRVRPVTRCGADMPGHTGSILHSEFSANGKLLASASGDFTVRLWDLNTNMTKHILKGHTNWVQLASFSPDCRRLATGAVNSEVFIWDTGSRLTLRKLTGHKKFITGIAWEPFHLNPRCTRCVTCSKDGTAIIWNVDTGVRVATLGGHTASITCVKWGGNGVVYTGSQDRTIKLWDTTRLTSSGSVTMLASLKGHGHWVNSITLCSEHVLRCGPYVPGEKRQWGEHIDKLDRLRQRRIRDIERQTTARVSSLDKSLGEKEISLKEESVKKDEEAKPQKTISAATDEFYAAENAILLELQSIAKKAYDECIKACGGTEVFVSCSDDFTLFLWRPSATKRLKKPTARMTGHQQPVNHVLFSPNGLYVASASFDHHVKIWNGQTGRFVCSFRGHVGPVYKVAWSSDSRYLVSCSKDSTVKLWDLAAKKLKTDLPGHADEVFALDWSPDGSGVVSGGRDKIVKLWKY
ncbi:Notchless protein homolog 1 [Aduncisulcus paluster]|uniref:Notchless protein homolog 1 n=1 Tax=Aduncisulcus paluster TaxID=2918883 RepID=A0ABQ5KPZ3_9EUKA|nr:Notchless protein homolog 1 [Aduncisulcus paluster]|eukprot:gnl/Carplike_NY0171/5712_a7835_302.p1 GENE.gnl/Carplike_NY0171/5712_a7835_302~~gnl/Carplike_NY0171/5712_a7835_302.p1  ORF type:complete len:546 (-),score=86.94 gnl/Carplike_NY0171/5712_a7835_302:1284-2921(-)